MSSDGIVSREQFLRRKPSKGPSCLMLDVSLPGMSGLDFQQRLSNAGLQIPIIFVTGWRHSDDGEGYEVGCRGISDQAF